MGSKVLFSFFLMIPAIAFSQNKADKEILASLQKNTAEIHRLSNRENPPAAEQKFIASQFQEANLQPAVHSGSYFQDIIQDHGRQFIPGTSLSINGQVLTPNTDFIPLPYSAQGSASGDPLISVQEPHLPWIMDIGNYSGTQLTGSDTDVSETMLKLAAEAIQSKATAAIFYNSNATAKDISFDEKAKASSLSIPVVYVQHAAAMQYFKDQTGDAKIKLTVSFHDQRDTAYNVIGSIDHGASSTIIITARKQGDKAALIELGRLLKDNKHYSKENYLLVAYNQDKGADFFWTHPIANRNQVNCVINMDGTGESGASPSSLVVSGTNTSPQWESVLRKVKDREVSLQHGDANSPESSGPKIPFLSFSTADTTGGQSSAQDELKTVQYLGELIRELNRTGKLAYISAN